MIDWKNLNTGSTLHCCPICENKTYTAHKKVDGTGFAYCSLCGCTEDYDTKTDSALRIYKASALEKKLLRKGKDEL